MEFSLEEGPRPLAPTRHGMVMQMPNHADHLITL
jgi:hypothetical protein